ncbi:MAG: protein-methionine-sulfoxide reductase catalytic subunit MsrP [Anderseniella sp.]
MLIKTIHSWEIPESKATSEHVFLNRRKFVAAAGFAGIGLATGIRASFASDDPSASLYPVNMNPAYKDAGRKITPEEVNITYNNFYEFGTSKRISEAAKALVIRPWEIAFDGEVEAPLKMGFDDLLKKVQLEERVYRHRCVEAWSMVVPWSGFTVKQLLDIAKPTANAKYVQFQTFNDPEIAPGQKPSLFGGSYPWPYTEAITMEEAGNDLAFMVTGAYGKPVAKSMGAPIRLHLPWKYGFKSAKSINRITFTAERPKSFWEVLGPSEYGFWANVNPDVAHPRWSQASERDLETGSRIPTVLYNGYGEQVAGLYEGMKAELDDKLYR